MIQIRWLLPDVETYTDLIPDLRTAPRPEAAVVREMCCIGVEILEKAIAQNILRVGDLVLRDIVQRKFYVDLRMMVSVIIPAIMSGERNHVQRLLVILRLVHDGGTENFGKSFAAAESKIVAVLVDLLFAA